MRIGQIWMIRRADTSANLSDPREGDSTKLDRFPDSTYPEYWWHCGNLFSIQWIWRANVLILMRHRGILHQASDMSGGFFNFSKCLTEVIIQKYYVHACISAFINYKEKQNCRSGSVFVIIWVAGCRRIAILNNPDPGVKVAVNFCGQQKNLLSDRK